MKTLTSILFAALILNTTATWAQGVRNGDPGLALTNSQTLPTEVNPMKKLAVAFERGANPSKEHLVLAGSMLRIGHRYFNNSDGSVEKENDFLKCYEKYNGSLFDSEVFCDSRDNLDSSWELVDFNANGVQISESKTYLRIYENQIIGIRYGINGKCPLSGKEPNEDNICVILYMHSLQPVTTQ